MPVTPGAASALRQPPAEAEALTWPDWRRRRIPNLGGSGLWTCGVVEGRLIG